VKKRATTHDPQTLAQVMSIPARVSRDDVGRPSTTRRTTIRTSHRRARFQSVVRRKAVEEHELKGTGAEVAAAAVVETTQVRGRVWAHDMQGNFHLEYASLGTAFHERVVLEADGAGRRLETSGGRDADDDVWDIDWYGIGRVNALDGAHLSAMMTWVRTNQWQGEAKSKLRLKQLAAGCVARMAIEKFGVSTPKRLDVDKKKVKKRAGGRSRERERGGTRAQAAPKLPACPTSVYAMTMLDGGRVSARVFVDELTGYAWRAEFYHQRGVEQWTYEGWEKQSSSSDDDNVNIAVPVLAHRIHAEGNVTVFQTSEAKASQADAEAFSMPSTSSSSRVSWKSREGGDVPLVACRGEGGHILVKAKTSSEDWYVLDTASTGMAIAPSVADAASMESFGSMSIVGVAASLEGRLRVGSELVFGDLTMSEPIFMEQNLDGALRMPNGERLGGVLGCPILAHAVVRVHAPLRVPGSRDAPKITVYVCDRESYSPSPEVERAWQPVALIDGVPYVELTYTIANDGFQGVTEMTTERKGLFKLALGTGGVGAVLTKRVADDADVANRTRALQPGGIMSGPGESSGRLQRVGDEIITGRVETIKFNSFELKNVRAVIHLDGDQPDLDLSPHADGAVCADAIRGCELVLDLNPTAPRLAVVPP